MVKSARKVDAVAEHAAIGDPHGRQGDAQSELNIGLVKSDHESGAVRAVVAAVTPRIRDIQIVVAHKYVLQIDRGATFARYAAHGAQFAHAHKAAKTRLKCVARAE